MTEEPASTDERPRPVLYVLVCGSPVARDVGRLVDLAQRRGYDVCVVATPDGRKFLDIPALAAQTGHPVRTNYKNPGDPDVLPPPDALVVAPATVNTVNKWAAGIADTLPLGLLIEGYGKGLPIVAFPYTNEAMARHPMFQENLTRLRSWGVRVLYGDEVVALPEPGNGDAFRHEFPWELALRAVDERLSQAGVRVGA
ncbi:flavoprotein [Catellatospora tritici]|uniref:flavoprotein n=1 Tax=Catellatospora tritici TaxID=2851566 RepID=UPI001C2DAF70|nr:flavoprotein [Catellatospora tritici]MBV1848732.1 flavoprotein [Catellatospora tritici]